VGVCFHLLAGGAAINIISNKGAYSGPPVVTFNQLFGAEASGDQQLGDHGGVPGCSSAAVGEHKCDS